MSSKNGSRFRSPWPVYVSVCAHALLTILFVTAGIRIHPKLVPAAGEYQIAMLQTAGGSAMAKSLFMAPTGDRKSDKEQPEHRPSLHPAPGKRIVSKAAGSASLAAQPKNHGTSSAAGNGSDAQTATFPFPTFSPKPPVTDRSLLPSSDRQIVLDVKLSAAGEVIGETLVTGMGNALDQIALSTVKTWRFQPATVNGQAVPSEAEVIFTFGPHYPVSG